jgi:hypothetical protein
VRPSADVNDLVLGVLGRAQHLFGVELHISPAIARPPVTSPPLVVVAITRSP